MKVLCIGDVFGERGLEALERFLPYIKQQHTIHLIIANGENVANGFGITKDTYKSLMKHGVRVVTLGNHAFSKREVLEFIDDSNIIRPANFHDSVPGKGYITINHNQETITVINVMGRIFMGDPLDNPFHTVKQIVKELNSDYIFVDIHAEATSEKIALAQYLDGDVTAIFGTHTHVPTNDAMRLPKGTFYVTDLGMTGTKYGILGADHQTVIDKFVDGMPRRLHEDTSKELQFNAVLIDTDKQTIETIRYTD